MKIIHSIIIFLCMFIVMTGSRAHAETVPYQISLISPFQTSSTLTSVKGVRISVFSAVNNNVSGIDVGMVNLTDGNQSGLQFGFYNRNLKNSGVQIGLINKTTFLEGLQIGLLNFHEKGDWKVLPLVNFKF